MRPENALVFFDTVSYGVAKCIREITRGSVIAVI